ncbi:hypothetical protein DSM19430T_09260 [Desulfovibrio psychrotolerans]|uniref:Uncharacterized protein n=1 Tax=Desulfovibrio psychrotolerans TaxID=415242 RepID=A0A7J0BSU2_9BACT|nr:hypothetical protein DSM19430T_09260 [Desulfovibrio psychrotolerans]
MPRFRTGQSPFPPEPLHRKDDVQRIVLYTACPYAVIARPLSASADIPPGGGCRKGKRATGTDSALRAFRR